MELSKTSLSCLIQLYTGHNFLSKHQNKIDSNINPQCRLCEEQPETFVHFITDCPGLETLRRKLFLDPVASYGPLESTGIVGIFTSGTIKLLADRQRPSPRAAPHGNRTELFNY
jgi:hypothetical protein